MAEVIETYANQAEADALIAQYEAIGWRQLHMDFAPDWKPGDEPHGTLTFTDEMPPHSPPRPSCPEFEPSNPNHDPPTKIRRIEEFLVELTAFCKERFG